MYTAGLEGPHGTSRQKADRDGPGTCDFNRVPGRGPHWLIQSGGQLTSLGVSAKRRIRQTGKQGRPAAHKDAGEATSGPHSCLWLHSYNLGEVSASSPWRPLGHSTWVRSSNTRKQLNQLSIGVYQRCKFTACAPGHIWCRLNL